MYDKAEVIHVNTIAENKKFITTAELKDMGYSYYKIVTMPPTAAQMIMKAIVYFQI